LEELKVLDETKKQNKTKQKQQKQNKKTSIKILFTGTSTFLG